MVGVEPAAELLAVAYVEHVDGLFEQTEAPFAAGWRPGTESLAHT